MNKTRRDLMGLAGLTLGVASLPQRDAWAAEMDYPAKPIKLIVPFPPGGGTDLIGRFLATHLSSDLGRTVIVENRAGAGGMIGSQACANAPADGYTLWHHRYARIARGDGDQTNLRPRGGFHTDYVVGLFAQSVVGASEFSGANGSRVHRGREGASKHV